MQEMAERKHVNERMTDVKQQWRTGVCDLKMHDGVSVAPKFSFGKEYISSNIGKLGFMCSGGGFNITPQNFSE